MAFVSSFLAKPDQLAQRARPASCRRAAAAPTAALDLVPGVPSGQDARSGAPLRSYVPRPVETYESRGFAEVLPKTWEGEIESIGAGDAEVQALTSDGDAVIEVDAASSGAFLDYAAMMAEERAAALAKFNTPSPEQTGRATCGEEEGREFVSNSRDILVSGTKCVEYWGTQW